jgi:hypothetical protein
MRYTRGQRTTANSPVDATEALRADLSEWRKRHKAPTPIPEALWARAATLAAQHGICKTARALHLDYASLKRKTNLSAPPSPPATTFIELLSPVTGQIAECALEIESSRGGRMRVVMKNLAPGGLASIIRDFVG